MRGGKARIPIRAFSYCAYVALFALSGTQTWGTVDVSCVRNFYPMSLDASAPSVPVPVPSPGASSASTSVSEPGSTAAASVSVKPSTLASILSSGWLPFLLFVLWPVFYFLVYQTVPHEPTGIRNPEVLKYFVQFGPYFGALVALLSLLGYAIVLGIAKLVRLGKQLWLRPLLWGLSFLPWLFFARELVYREKRWTDIGIGFIDVVGGPLLSASTASLVFAALWFLAALLFVFKKR